MENYFTQLDSLVRQSNMINAAQLHVMNDIRGSLQTMAGELAAIRQSQLEGLALQQAALQREIFQDKIEEFVYQLQKAVTAFEQRDGKYPPSAQYFFLGGVFSTVESEGLTTAIIRGRDNKQAFEESLEKARRLYRQLEKHPEVKQALEWAEAQEKKRLSAAGQQERAIRDLQQRITQLQKSRRRVDFGTWYGEKFAWVNQQEGMRYFLHALLWIFLGYVWIPVWYKLSAPSEEARLNADVDRLIRELETKLQKLEGGS